MRLVMYNGKENEKRKEKWVKYYSSFHQILLVGDGDFSFSLCLALSFGSASNIIASSLDSYDVVIKKYEDAKSNLEMLDKLGAYCLHGVDATKMKLHTDLRMRKFDRIIYNFPHAGFHGKEDNLRLINMHRNLVHGFFRNASGMLRSNGEIHINHKTTAPFCQWNIQELANQNSLALIESVDFRIKDYPGYRNKRGSGGRCDEPFHLGKCRTFKFGFSQTAKKLTQLTRKRNRGPAYSKPHQLQMIQSPVPRHSENSFTYSNLGTRRSDCCRIFEEYFDHALETFGNIDYDLGYSTLESLRLGFERYTAEQPGKPLKEFIPLLEELQHLSNLRSWVLQCMLSDDDDQLLARRCFGTYI